MTESDAHVEGVFRTGPASQHVSFCSCSADSPDFIRFDTIRSTDLKYRLASWQSWGVLCDGVCLPSTLIYSFVKFVMRAARVAYNRLCQECSARCSITVMSVTDTVIYGIYNTAAPDIM